MTVSDVNSVTQRARDPQPDLERLRTAIGSVVGSVFYGTLFKTMRESALNGPYGHGGRGEEVFAAQLHAHLAEEMGTSRAGGLADVLYKRLEHNQRTTSARPAAG